MKKIKVDPSKRILMDIASRNSCKKQKLCSSDNSQDKINQSEHSISDLIVKPHEHDVLCGRGNFANYHDGNSRFRELVKNYKIDYVSCTRCQKKGFSQLIYNKIQELDPPGRFLKYDVHSNIWTDIGEKRALEKIRQALREGAPDIMKVLSPELRAAEMILDLKRQNDLTGESETKVNGDFRQIAPSKNESPSKDIKRQNLDTQPDVQNRDANHPGPVLSNFNLALVHNDDRLEKSDYREIEEKMERFGHPYHDQYDNYKESIHKNCTVNLQQEKIIPSKFSPVGERKKNIIKRNSLKLSEADTKEVDWAVCTKIFASAAIAGPKIVPTRYF